MTEEREDEEVIETEASKDSRATGAGDVDLLEFGG